ncbi:polyprotein [Phytophthora megakarya]|uniref:Polyprotein n=1 Tax=Phytophthora megakarya TaxID=4795 RepID=A0A225WG72_9STRA|nr:polyprotein [Phytophthora megakarya]
MENCNGCATPQATSPSKADVPTTTAYLPYRELVDALQYLVSASRPDIIHATRHLGKYLSSYDHTHYAQAKRVLRYLKSTCDYGLVMNARMQQDVRICSYSNADYANAPVNRRSISAYVTMIEGNVLSNASRKQEINALSTCEVEYVAMSEVTKDLFWLAGLCKELHWTHPVPLLYGANQGAIALTLKPGNIRRNVGLKHIDTQYVGTDAMVADVMTKAVGAEKFAGFRKAMKVLPLVGENAVTPASETADEASVTKFTATAAERQAKDCVTKFGTYFGSWCCAGYDGGLLCGGGHDDLALAAEIKWECEVLLCVVRGSTL